MAQYGLSSRSGSLSILQEAIEAQKMAMRDPSLSFQTRTGPSFGGMGGSGMGGSLSAPISEDPGPAEGLHQNVADDFQHIDWSTFPIESLYERQASMDLLNPWGKNMDVPMQNQ